MDVSTTTQPLHEIDADLLAVAVSRPLEQALARGPAQRLDEALGGALSRLVESGEARGAAGTTTLLHTDGTAVAARRVALLGLGAGEKAGADQVRLAAARAARLTEEVGGASLALCAEGLPDTPAEALRWLVEGALLGSYRFERYRSRPRDDEGRGRLRSLVIAGSDDRAGAERAALVAEATNRARDLQNAPPNDLTPERLAERAREIAGAEDAVSAEILDEDALRSRGMGALLAVAQASSAPARVAVLRYEPAGADGPVLGLVGKGITFDSGGISLKPAARMAAMKSDMSGAAAVLEATAAIAALGLPLRVIAVAGATENMPDSGAYRPGDIVTAANGKTIEITNTDAEGRLVLADCLHLARELGATHIVDLATLTGAVVVALGDYWAGVMGPDAEWVERIRAAGERSGEHVWPLPVHDTLRRFFRSQVADMVNSSDARMAGPIYAARFLQEFAGEGPWAHLDIAGTAFLERSRGDEFRKGGTGYGVRLLVELAESLC